MKLVNSSLYYFAGIATVFTIQSFSFESMTGYAFIFAGFTVLILILKILLEKFKG